MKVSYCNTLNVFFSTSCSVSYLLQFACMCVWQAKREGVNCTNPLLWRLLLYTGKQMLWVEPQPVWRIHNDGCCVRGSAAANVWLNVFVPVFMHVLPWGLLIQLLVTVTLKAFLVWQGLSWRPENSLRRTEEKTLTGKVEMAGHDEEGGTWSTK